MEHRGATPPFNPKHLMVLGVLESIVLMSAGLRIAVLPDGVNLSRGSHLAWFVGTVFLSGAGIATFVVGSLPLARRALAGDDVTEARRQLLITAVSIILGALLLSLAGPGVVARVLGDTAP
jgi:hypothetical protein